MRQDHALNVAEEEAEDLPEEDQAAATEAAAAAAEGTETGAAEAAAEEGNFTRQRKFSNWFQENNSATANQIFVFILFDSSPKIFSAADASKRSF